jgi:flagellar biosynthetic protein FlhB
MAENADGQEKTEDPSEKRLRESREKGDIARSRELTTFLMVISAALFLYVFGPGMMASFEQVMVAGLSLDRDHVFDMTKAVDLILGMAVASLLMITPFLILMLAVAVIGSSLLGGFNFSTKALAPKFEKLNPLSGIKRMVSAQALMELLKALAKFSLVLLVAVAFIYLVFGELISLGMEAEKQALAHAAKIIIEAFIVVSLALIVVAIVDVPFQIYQHQNKLKMTKQEVKEEYKQQEGNPEVKARIRRIQMEMSQKRMMQKVPEADVVITNPTHFAIALAYKPKEMSAPIVLAMGADFQALQIRTMAAEHDIAIIEAPALARALYYNAEIDRPIPDGLFRAVAAVLAYVFSLREGRQASFDPTSLFIPPELKQEP